MELSMRPRLIQWARSTTVDLHKNQEITMGFGRGSIVWDALDSYSDFSVYRAVLASLILVLLVSPIWYRKCTIR